MPADYKGPKLILAYDKSTFERADQDQLQDVLPYVHLVKVGSQAMTAREHDGICVAHHVLDFVVHNLGLGVFYDFKLHEVGKAIKNTIPNFKDCGVDMLTFHMDMSDASLALVAQLCNTEDIMSFGVSVLTDLTAKECMDRYGKSPEEKIVADACKARELGFDGLVSSVPEALFIKEQPDLRGLKLLSPAIRPVWWKGDDDQVRTASPTEAAQAAVDYVVVGRPILSHDNPVRAARHICEEMDSATRIMA